MRAIFIFVASMLAQELFASPTLPDVSPSTPYCARVSFTQDYMHEHPIQNASEVWMMLYKRADPEDQTLYMNLQVTMRGEVYRAGLLCDRKPGGQLHCAIECDGGQAEIFQNGESASHQFFINHGLNVNGECNPIDRAIVWEPAPGEENIYDMQATPCT